MDICGIRETFIHSIQMFYNFRDFREYVCVYYTLKTKRNFRERGLSGLTLKFSFFDDKKQFAIVRFLVCSRHR